MFTRRSMVGLIGLAGALPRRAAAQAGSGKTITLASGLDPSFTHFVVATRKGMFEREGIKADFRVFDDGNVALDSLLTGNADIGMTSELGGLARISRGGKIYVVAVAVRSPQFFGIAASSAIKTPQDLLGKTIGVPKGSGAHLYFGKYTQKYGLDPARITLKFIQAPEMVPAFARGDIDGFFLWDPWLTRAMQIVPGSHVLAHGGDENVLVLNSYLFFSERLVSQPQLAQASLKALIGAADWIDANRPDAIALSSATFNIPTADATRMFSIFSWPLDFPASISTNFADAAVFAKSAGVINQTPDMGPYLRPEFLRAVAPSRVTA